MTCDHCGALTDNGLALCALCQRKATVDLEFIPVYFRNLARWRPGRAGARPVPGSREPGRLSSGGGDRVGRMLDEAGADMAGWMRCLARDRDVEIPQRDDEAEALTAQCESLARHLTSVATLDWAGAFVTATGYYEAALRNLTEDVVPGWYAGACRRCESATYVVPGLTWVTCRACGVTTYARDHIETILDEARGWVAPPMRMAEALVALVDTELSVPRLHKRISKWGERERVQTLRRLDSDGDPVGPKRFRLGDVLDLLLAEGATRLGENDAQDAAVVS